ncbi:fatty acid-binding protein, intestinal-like [Polyodon spathula]|uniref:fatty acid-binding protein, intestinal-like n=1 Tax=Polyodon spathula TaxID=7913 RepID=UPI001B7E3850|nr:fatty acid-binding protein, intestinal-like [Polyodon spathula]
MSFEGNWIEYKNEKFDDFLAAMGVNADKRKLAQNMKLQLTMKQDGKKFTMTEKSLLRTKEMSWTVDEEFTGDLADGSVMKGTYTLESPTCFVGKFTRTTDGKEIVNRRKVDGDEMIQTTKVDGVEMKRYFKRQEASF